MNLLKEAFIEGYKQRAEGSDLIFDNASRMYAISLFDKYQAEQLTLTDVVKQSELLLGFQKSEYFDLYEQGVLEYKDAIEKYLA